MRRSKTADSLLEFEQTVFLGSRVSEKDSFYKDYALIDPDDAFLAWFLRHEQVLSDMEPKDAMVELVLAMGQFEYMKSVTELTQLSMKLGDTRKRVSAHGLMDILKIVQNEESDKQTDSP